MGLKSALSDVGSPSSHGEGENLKELELLLKEDNENGKHKNQGLQQQAQAPPKSSSSGAVTGQSLFFFIILVGQSIGSQTYFKLSQRGGKYEYNTMSAMFLVEFFKLGISLTQLMVANRGNVKACTASFKNISKRVYMTYLFLALSYAAYNQLIFYVMKLVDPGTFSLFKSLMPGVVAFLNYIAFQKTLTQAQIFCIMIQIFGIVPVTASADSESGKVDFTYGIQSMIVMSGAIAFAAFNTVYNAHVVKKESANSPIAVQNGILYCGGCFFNLLFYFLSRKAGDERFFHGYNNMNVLVLLFLNSTVGVTISLVYKYGDAVLKTMSQPVVSSVLLFLSNILFDAPLDIIKISGAGSVIVSTMLYLQLPPPVETMPSSPKQLASKPMTLNKTKWFMVGLLLLICYSVGHIAKIGGIDDSNTTLMTDSTEISPANAEVTNLLRGSQNESSSTAP